MQVEYFITADAMIDGALASGSTFTDFQFTNPDLPRHPDLPSNFVFADFGETLSDTLLYDLTVPAAVPGANGTLAVPFHSGSSLSLVSVPEPRTWTIVSAALLGLLFVRPSHLSVLSRD